MPGERAIRRVLACHRPGEGIKIGIDLYKYTLIN